MISAIKTCWLVISLPIFTTFLFQNYETITFTSVFLPLYIIGTFSLKKLEIYSINQRELNKTKLITNINDNIENAEDEEDFNLILPKLKELKSYYESMNNYFITPTEKKNETNLFIFIHSKTMFQIIC
jgi:hypothetical protein